MAFAFKYPTQPSVPFDSSDVNIFEYNPTGTEITLDVPIFQGYNIVRFSGPIDNISNPVDIYINPNTAGTAIGTIMYIMVKMASNDDNSVSLHFNENTMYTTACGDYNDTINVGNLERVVLVYIFDGEKFVCSYDNC